MSGNFYKGTSKEQTPFFKDKDSQLIAQRKWPEIFEQEVDMSKVNVEVMKAWINHKITELLGFEDDIVISYCLSQLVPEEALAADVDEKHDNRDPAGVLGEPEVGNGEEKGGNPQYCAELNALTVAVVPNIGRETSAHLLMRVISTDDTIPDAGGGMRGWDNDDAPAARARAPEAAVDRVEEAAERGGRDQTGGEAGVVAGLRARLARPAEARTGIETIGVADQAIKTELEFKQRDHLDSEKFSSLP
ncbi:hypothetical protein ACSSS7_004076 [Eimeria intestinalis]